MLFCTVHGRTYRVEQRVSANGNPYTSLAIRCWTPSREDSSLVTWFRAALFGRVGIWAHENLSDGTHVVAVGTAFPLVDDERSDPREENSSGGGKIVFGAMGLDVHRIVKGGPNNDG